MAPVTPIRPGGAAGDEAPRGVERQRAGSGTPIFASIEQASLKALGRRSLSRRELERALAARDFAEHEIADEIDRLEGVGLIDDFALAHRLVTQLQERKGLVGSALKAELVRRILHPDAIAYAMDLVATGDELERATELATVRARQYGRLDPDTIERRLSGWLMRRGFSGSVVRSAVEAAVAGLRSA